RGRAGTKTAAARCAAAWVLPLPGGGGALITPIHLWRALLLRRWGRGGMPPRSDGCRHWSAAVVVVAQSWIVFPCHTLCFLPCARSTVSLGDGTFFLSG
ncbi:hypothetical protein NDU88_011129, partial [Pleurodeles waltl]